MEELILKGPVCPIGVKGTGGFTITKEIADQIVNGFKPTRKTKYGTLVGNGMSWDDLRNQPHSHEVQCLEISEDGHWIIATIRVLNTKIGRAIKTLYPIGVDFYGDVAINAWFNPDGEIKRFYNLSRVELKATCDYGGKPFSKVFPKRINTSVN